MTATRFSKFSRLQGAANRLDSAPRGKRSALPPLLVAGLLACVPGCTTLFDTEILPADATDAADNGDGASDADADSDDVPEVDDPEVDDPDGDDPDGDGPDDEVEIDETDGAEVTPSSNACGGSETLLLDGAPAELGAACGCGGDVVCNGLNQLRCADELALNLCGGCGVLAGAPGDDCGRCDDGTFICTGGVLVCEGASSGNLCGGCQTLDQALRAPCDDDGEPGSYRCDGLELVVCDSDPAVNDCGGAGELLLDGNAVIVGQPCDAACGVGDADGLVVCDGFGGVYCDGPVANACGGCGPLLGEPGDACGCDGAGRWECDAESGTARCAGGEPNACGGCDALLPSGATLGDSCTGGVWGCTSEDTLACVTGESNACGGRAELDETVGDRCGACDSGTFVCETVDSVICDGDLGVRAFNACEGCGVLPAPLGSACGTCASGQWACSGEDALLCEGDAGEAARNVCGGCETLAAAPGDECGDCAVWECSGTGLLCRPEPSLPGCEELELTCAELACSAQNRDCDEGEVGVDAQCAACSAGFREVDGNCVAAECVDNSGCPELATEWSPCDWADVCDEASEQTRAVTPRTCADGVCVAGTDRVERQACEARDTDGETCGTAGLCGGGVCSEAPDAPTGLSASDGSSAIGVDLRFTASAGAAGYRVLRDGSEIAQATGFCAGSSTEICFTDLSAPAPPAPPAPTGATASTDREGDVLLGWQVVSPEPGATASYSVVALSAGGVASPASSADTGYRAAEPVTSYEVEIDGAWTSAGLSTTFTDLFAPLPSITGGVVSVEPTAAGNVLSVSGSSAQPGAERAYRFRAVSAAGAGSASDEVVGRRSGGSVSAFEWLRSQTNSGFVAVPSATDAAASLDANADAECGAASWNYRVVVSSTAGVSAEFTSAGGPFCFVRDLSRPVLLEPAQNANPTSTLQTFRWTEVDRATQYSLFVSADENDLATALDDGCPNCVVSEQLSATEFAVTAGILEHNTPYYWVVSAIGPAVDAVSSDIGNFETGDCESVAECPALQDPWSACDYADACDEAAERTRTVTPRTCVDFSCVAETSTEETEACARVIDDGTPCDAGACYAGVCSAPPVAPALSASDGTSSAHVEIRIGVVAGATNYRVIRDGSEIGQTSTFCPGTSLEVCYWDSNAPAPSIPGAPSNVAASSGRDSDVRVTWTVPTSASGTPAYFTAVAENDNGQTSEQSSADSGYRGAIVPSAFEVSIDGGAWENVGSITSWLDTSAPAGTITPCTVAASDGTSSTSVELTCSGASVANGTGRSYAVRAVWSGGQSAPSNSALGRRNGGTLAIGWERSADDADADYRGLPVTGVAAADTSAPLRDGRFYRPVLTAGAGVATVRPTADRGYMAGPPLLTELPPSQVRETRAALAASLDDFGAPSLTGLGFCFKAGSDTDCGGRDDASPCASGWTPVPIGALPRNPGAFEETVEGLTSGTLYSYCAYASNFAGFSVSGVSTFATQLPAYAECFVEGPTSTCATGYCGNDRCTTDGFQYIPAGIDIIGAPASGDLGTEPDERPQHTVVLSAFEMMRNEVTQSDWFAVTGANPAYFQNTTCTSGTCAGTENANPNGPVENVDWYSTLAYANALSRRDGLQECYTLTPSTCADTVSDWRIGDTACTGATFAGVSCTGYRLPTEAEWEFAVRAGSDTSTPDGDFIFSPYSCGDQANLRNLAWWCFNAGNRTQAVRGKSPNDHGLYDVLGNVWEWTWDRNGAYSSATAVNPLGAANGNTRVLRGGAYNNQGQPLRSAYRYDFLPAGRGDNIGFRLVRSVPADTAAIPAYGACTEPGPTTTCATGFCGNGRCTTPEFQYIPAGSDVLGAPSTELGTNSDERPQHTVVLSAFEMMRTEVTQEAWHLLTGTNPSYFQTPTCTNGACLSTENSNPTAPVERVDWYSALAYANALSRAAGLTECYELSPTTCADEVSDWRGGDTGCTDANFLGVGCNGYRLPTEAEWEFAARAGTDGATWAGDLTALDCRDTRLPDIAWIECNALNRSRTVGGKPSNPLGVSDLLGNVWEWTWDRSGAYSSSASTNPLGGSGTSRVVRGGSWSSQPFQSRAAYRGNDPPDRQSNNVGFRLARSVPADTAPIPAYGACSVNGPTTTCATGFCGNGRCTTPEFQYIPAGSDVLGAPSSELGTSSDERPLHTVTLNAFELMRYEVTQSQWFAVAGVNPSYFQTTTCTDTNCASNENLNPTAPVERVDWYSTLAFANVLSRAAGLTECYTLTPNTCADAVSDWSGGVTSCTGATFAGIGCNGYRLPTEAEWEYAARAGTDSATYNGSLTAVNCTDTTLGAIAWSLCNSGSRSRVSGGMHSNMWGVYDALGNVWEFVWDRYGPYSSLENTNPLGPGDEAVAGRLIRGGGWATASSAIRAANRVEIQPTVRLNDVGFRLARSVPPDPIPAYGVCSTEGVNALCSTGYCGNGRCTTPDFQYIPAGSDLLGTPSTENGSQSDEQPPHTVSLNAFELMRTEVTQGEWHAISGANPSYFSTPTCSIGGSGRCGTWENANPNAPVDRVDWYAALAYANALSVASGLSPCYTLSPSTCADSVSDWAEGDTTCTGATFDGIQCTGFRLPTEAEWEYAARAGTDSATYSSNNGGELLGSTTVCGGHPALTDIAWFCNNAGNQTHPVATKSANAWGLHDMLGNLWEWAWDLKGNYDSAPVSNPLGAASGGFRVIRGGGFGETPGSIRAGKRAGFSPGNPDWVIGFRLARSVP